MASVIKAMVAIGLLSLVLLLDLAAAAVADRELYSAQEKFVIAQKHNSVSIRRLLDVKAQITQPRCPAIGTCVSGAYIRCQYGLEYTNGVISSCSCCELFLNHKQARNCTVYSTFGQPFPCSEV
ncbi:hypothetical protein O6H91_07G065400 [Diphasiastrum complanatum]|uniref:Uncharacterized protein n=1 Tax=Diphasiastrum complanatum TaxID=34168 RepID=A0ACC2D674_DIPCM|nr:hypothetical protein O6H91_07G065400 [Diphasiastrum complanatum]